MFVKLEAQFLEHLTCMCGDDHYRRIYRPRMGVYFCIHSCKQPTLLYVNLYEFTINQYVYVVYICIGYLTTFS